MKLRKLHAIQIYSPLEEKLNVGTHFFGLVMSVFATVFLIFRAVDLDSIWAIISFPVFGVSMMVLYLASTLYHSSKTPKRRHRMNIFDHSAIYVLIAGTYTPFALVSLNGDEGYFLFFLVWGIAVIGVVFKIFFTGRFDVLSTSLYVAMGWLIIVSIKSLIHNLDFHGLVWLISGGIAYTLGAVLYSIHKLKFNHTIFHVFVLIGTFCHFMAVYFYVIPISAITA